MRFISFSGGRIKLVSLICLLLVGTSLLSGCEGMMHQLGYKPIEKPETKACANAPVLITNLTVDAHHRQYQLPNGHVCLGVNYDKQDHLQVEPSATFNNL